MIKDATYVNTDQSSALRRDDLGNAESLNLKFSVPETSGDISFNFRGVEIAAKVKDQKLEIRADGVNESHEIPFTMATNTIHELQMSYDPHKTQMRVQMNRLEAVEIPLATAHSSLIISPDGKRQSILTRGANSTLWSKG